MGDFAMIRQYGEMDLIGVLFRPITNLDHVKFEVLEPEWVNGAYYSSTAGATTNNSDMRSAIVDCSKYDYVIYGVNSEVSGNVYSGLRAASDSGTLAKYIMAHSASSSAYSIDDCSTNKYLLVSQSKTRRLPIIGIMVD